jgi:AcrR family transcriptional regulator
VTRTRPTDAGRAARPPDGTSGAGTRSAEDGPEARDRILDAAQDLIARDGFAATPTAQIADRAKVPKGLLFYYFPKKVDLLRTLLAERLPAHPLFAPGDVAVHGDIPGSLVRLARGVDASRSASPVLASILFREAGTHPEVGHHLRAMHDGLVDLTERVLDVAASFPLNHRRRREAAQTFVALLLHTVNSRRYDGPLPDLTAAASMVSAGLAPADD